ncbi:fumarylacetoacetate hydrolase family protein [Sphingomonas sp. AOB5]|uniref:fumarylacetoacetate hydrolase family protein n=1 Tax=Sphingomonas sp. AOB5 TaxID=3034017 RepID=UPI0023F77D19|nr:fumarylacetoacetate hydrolase family protein [Sphingomonas sp. AOB5]MDF7776078.1 fumarylacetoacetate hydrolase family protein [Sphingomonas sp. AOB5]
MKLATLKSDGRDGRLVVVARDLTRAVSADGIAATMQDALERWSEVEAPLRALFNRLQADEAEGAFDFDPTQALAPLPRAWQWLDGSAYKSHGALMDKVFGMDPPKTDRPLMYQGVSDQFLSATADVPMRNAEEGIDFEGEFGIIVDEVPMGTAPADAMRHIRLIVQINDWSLRKLAPIEMKTGFGWIQAKPPCSAAPVAVTPDELGAAWADGRVHLPLNVWWNEAKFGAALGGAMGHGFHELVAHAAHSRRLVAGTIIGSGTVSNENYREVGSSCIAERRGIEIEDQGEPKTPFMAFGDRVRMEVTLGDGTPVFGKIDQQVVEAAP